MTSPSLLTRLNPLYWLGRVERLAWALFAEVEYRLGIVPRGTPLAPRPFDRRLLRTVLIVFPMLVGSLFIERPLRTRLLLLFFLIVLLAVAVIFAADAWEGAKGGGPPAPPRPRPPAGPRPTGSRPAPPPGPQPGPQPGRGVAPPARPVANSRGPTKPTR